MQAISSIDVSLSLSPPSCGVALTTLPVTFSASSTPATDVAVEIIRADGSVAVLARMVLDASPKEIEVKGESLRPGKNRIVVWPSGTAKTASAPSFTLEVFDPVPGASLADGDGDCYSPAAGDCNDADAAIHPGAAELCDDIDNNCDGKFDETFDADKDGYAACAGGLALTHRVDGSACPVGYASCADCDDGDATTHPGAVAGFCASAGKSCQQTLSAAIDPNNIYVDVANLASGDGSQACPVRNISEAIPLAAAGGTIHVAAGTYNARNGEVFPLRFDQGVTVAGAGRGQTIVEGTDFVDLAEHDGFFTDFPYGGTFTSVTAWVHNSSGQVALRDLTMRTTNFNSAAFLCDRGTASSSFRPSPLPQANFVLDDVTVGPGYGYSGYVVHGGPPAPATPNPQGCNALITRSQFTGNDCGMWIAGGGAGPYNGHVVHLTLGEDATSGNQFSSIGTRAGGIGCAEGSVIAWDGASPLFARGNTFADSKGGIYAVHHPATDAGSISRAEFTDNTFLNLTSFGVVLDHAFVLEKLVGNRFEGITNAGGTAKALWLNGTGDLYGDGSTYLRPFVLAARKNTFLANDNGVVIVNAYTNNPLYTSFLNDFSANAITPDPGANVFACNSAVTGGALVGGDFVLNDANGDGNESLRLSNNAWDRNPPHYVIGALTANGQDLALPNSTTPVSSKYKPSTGASAHGLSCPANRTKGP